MQNAISWSTPKIAQVFLLASLCPLAWADKSCSDFKDAIVNNQPTRTMEQVRCVFDNRSGAIFTAYSKELSNPALRDGAIRIRLKIEPDGTQTQAAELVSSELNLPRLDTELVRIVSQFTFPPSQGPAQEFIFPINLFKN